MIIDCRWSVKGAVGSGDESCHGHALEPFLATSSVLRWHAVSALVNKKEGLPSGVWLPSKQDANAPFNFRKMSSIYRAVATGRVDRIRFPVDMCQLHVFVVGCIL